MTNKLLSILFLASWVQCDIILFSDQQLYTGDSFGPTNIKADSMCYTISETTIIPPYECANIFALLTYNATYQIADLPSYYGFSPTISVRSPNGNLFNSWGSIVANPPTPFPSVDPVIMGQSLVSGGVLADQGAFTDWWSGSLKAGVVAPTTCSQWTSTATNGYLGDGETTRTPWIGGISSLCAIPYQFVCACVEGTPTPKPTLQPTVTNSPTKNPSKNPTRYPTKSPLIRIDKQQVMYKIPKGTRGRIYKGASNNYTYFVMGSDINSPLNMTISATTVQPVLWTDVYWLKYNQTTDSVSTEYTSLCNPVANRAPGEVITTIHEYALCPTIYSCINGALTTISGGVFQDYRACILNKTVTVRTDIASGSASQLTVSMLDINASALTPYIVQDIFVANLRCNDFIDRSVNCQLKYLFKSSYRLQCVDESIQCYSYSQGRYFGAFWNANPFFRYDIPRANWTQAHWEGIASVMNYYISARNGKFKDAFTSVVWNAYFWLGGVTSLNIEQVEVFSYAFTFQNDYIQGQEYNYLAGTLLPPVTSPFSVSPFSSSIVDCMVQILWNASLAGVCENQDWDHIQDVQWRIPSFIRYIAIEPGTVVYSLTIEPAFNYTAIEVYNVFGELCGTYLKATDSGNVTISCLLTPSALYNFTTTSFLQIRYFGVHAIWDIPNATLSNSVPPHESDPFTISGYPFLDSTINLIYSVLYFFVYTVNGEIAPDEFNWPGRRNNISYLQDSRYFLNYTLNTTFSLGDTLDQVRQSILQNNTYPYNYALEAWVERNAYQQIPVNYTDETHLDWLYFIWANSLAPRQCTTFTDCMTAGRGKCIYPSSAAIQYSGGVPAKYWRQGDIPPGYTIPNSADEGGCFIYDVYSRGFYDRQLAGARCKQGYGPADNENELQIEQYQQLVADVGVFSGSNCKLPAWFDPISAPLVDYNLCAGHGKAEYTQTTSMREIVQYSDGAQWLFPTCDSILLDQVEYVRQQVKTVFIQQFVNENTILSVIHGQVFLNGTVCTYETTTLTCTEEYQFQCVSTFFYSHADVEFTSPGLNLVKGLSIYDISIGVF
jgi:hypothetical protein